MSTPADDEKNLGPIDWASAHARIARAARASKAGKPSPERLDEVFRQRARDLAAPLPDYGTTGRHVDEGATETVMARIGGQAFAVNTSAVREAVAVPRVTPLPGSALTLRGLANVRSRIVPAFDIRPLLNLSAGPKDSARETMLLIAYDGAEFGLIVDAVLGVRVITPEQLRREIPGLMTQFLQGVTDDGLVLLDLASLVTALTADERDI